MSANAAATPREAIVLEGLVKRYDDLVAVAGLDLTIKTGECFGLLGPNGAGKTTTVEIMEGLLPPTEGKVTILGRTWTEHEDELRNRIGVTLQETKLFEKLTVDETLTLFRTFYDDAKALSVERLLADMQLQEKRKTWVQKLSGGQRQRLAVALGLVGDPDILFLDEPTTGLDPQSRRALWDVVAALKGRGKTVVLTTHYMDEAERLCDRIAIVDHGKIIAEGTPSSLIDDIGGHHLLELAADRAVPAAAFEGLPGVRGHRAGTDTREGVSLALEEPHTALPAILAVLAQHGAAPTRLVSRTATLDDVFLSLTGRNLREE